MAQGYRLPAQVQLTQPKLQPSFLPAIELKRLTELGRQGPVIDIDTEEDELSDDLLSNTVVCKDTWETPSFSPGSLVKILQPPTTLKAPHSPLEEQGDGGRIGAGVEGKEANLGARLQEEVVRQGAGEVLGEQVAVVGLEVQGGDGHRRHP